MQENVGKNDINVCVRAHAWVYVGGYLVTIGIFVKKKISFSFTYYVSTFDTVVQSPVLRF